MRGPNSLALLSSQVVKVGLVEDSPSTAGECGTPLLLWSEGGPFPDSCSPAGQKVKTLGGLDGVRV